MKAPRRSRAAALTAVPGLVLVLALTACGGSAGGDAAASSAATSAADPAETTAAATPAAAGPIGAGCDVLPTEGPGSLAALASTPAGTAVNTNPQLTTLAQAVLAANLVDVVNTRADITVLAPTNAAFDALGPDAVPALVADVPRLTTVLTHHVLSGRLGPEELAGEHRTLQGDTVTVTGSGGSFSVAADRTLAAAAPATVVCGNVPTANATVYFIDQVLAPAG
ncbi:fasciclin domain-containing protein [Modestobacter marinus]|uniref:fasciclin domain-containing protein n=1 Tax=Modestobacter marinus TaxID=477641 RepID=UPI001C945F7F|nr:fasciclin domain-containing protein [Modestobacter marinus]